jgi:polygalacturonase
MADRERQLLSRRKWLGFISVPALTASLGAGLLDENALAGEPPTGGATADSNSGACTYNIRDFGAVGDGKTLDTAAVQAAIDACHKDEGGTVLVPAGVFVIGTVEMKSNVTLRIAAKGTLLGSADGKQYHAANAIPLEGDTTLRDGNVGLIFAIKAENITIEGTGTIDGQGAQFRSPRRGVPPPSGRGGSHRPYHLLFYQCKNLRVRDLYLVASAFHSIRVIESHFIWMTGLHIYNRVNGNNDGFHFISSEYVHVANCDVQSEDDACALFGSCRFVTITNSTFSTRWAVFRFGGGNPENVTISNCVIYETYGCPIKMQFGGDSQVENLTFSNLILQDVTGPISIDVNTRRRHRNTGAKEPDEKGYVRNISFSHIRARVVANPRQIAGIPFPQNHRPGETRQCIVLNCIGGGCIESVVFDDLQIVYGGGGTAAEARRKVPEVAGEYFEIGTPPAYALYARNVRALTMNNVRFETKQPDLRPAVMLEEVADVALNGFSANGNPQAMSVLRLLSTREVLITAARVLNPAAAFLQIEGAASENIIVDGGDLSKAAQPLAIKNGATKEAVKLRV